MNLQTLIDELTRLLPLLGPNAPVLQHERLRVTNDRDSVQVIDPEHEDAEIKRLQERLAQTEEELGDAEDEIEGLKDELKAKE